MFARSCLSLARLHRRLVPLHHHRKCNFASHESAQPTESPYLQPKRLVALSTHDRFVAQLSKEQCSEEQFRHCCREVLTRMEMNRHDAVIHLRRTHRPKPHLTRTATGHVTCSNDSDSIQSEDEEPIVTDKSMAGFLNVLHTHDLTERSDYTERGDLTETDLSPIRRIVANRGEKRIAHLEWLDEATRSLIEKLLRLSTQMYSISDFSILASKLLERNNEMFDKFNDRVVIEHEKALMLDCYHRLVTKTHHLWYLHDVEWIAVDTDSGTRIGVGDLVFTNILGVRLVVEVKRVWQMQRTPRYRSARREKRRKVEEQALRYSRAFRAQDSEGLCTVSVVYTDESELSFLHSNGEIIAHFSEKECKQIIRRSKHYWLSLIHAHEMSPKAAAKIVSEDVSELPKVPSYSHTRFNVGVPSYQAGHMGDRYLAYLAKTKEQDQQESDYPQKQQHHQHAAREPNDAVTVASAVDSGGSSQ